MYGLSPRSATNMKMAPKARTAAYWPNASAPNLRIPKPENANDMTLIASWAIRPHAEFRNTVRESLFISQLRAAECKRSTHYGAIRAPALSWYKATLVKW